VFSLRYTSLPRDRIEAAAKNRSLPRSTRPTSNEGSAALDVGKLILQAPPKWEGADRMGTLAHRAFAALYDLFMGFCDRLGLRRLRREVAAEAEGLVLEVAAGTGLNLPHYQAARRVVATDPEAAMLARARQRVEKAPRPVRLIAADAQALPFPDHTFDTVVATLAFCTIPEPEAAFRELRRVLKPGGKLHLLEHVRAPWRPLARLQDWLTPLWRRAAGGCCLNREPLATAHRCGFGVAGIRRSLGGIVVRATLIPR
jgi:SAM-dependent methyltransferase